MSEDYPANSIKKNNKPKTEKIITGEAHKRKKSIGSRIAENFTQDDFESVFEYILFDVIIPAAKSMISDSVSQGADRILFGTTKSKPSGSVRPGGYTAYNRMYSTNPVKKELSRRARANHEFDEIVLDSRGEAESVLDRLVDLVDTYEVATVADLYSLVGMTGSGFTDEQWGWFDLRDAEVIRVKDGYMLNLPRTRAINEE